jgi:hypothetical protein
MDERPRPDIDHTREALRQHDERVASEEEERESEEASSSEAAEDEGRHAEDDGE